MHIINIENKAGLPARSSNDRSHRQTLLDVFLFGAMLLALTMTGPSALAADDLDQLRLTGVIKSINADTGLVTVDVVSSTCSGMRLFKADDLAKLEDYVEQKLSFFIDSSTCDVKQTYTILTARGVRK